MKPRGFTATSVLFAILTGCSAGNGGQTPSPSAQSVNPSAVDSSATMARVPSFLEQASVFGRNLIRNPGAEKGPGATDSNTIDPPPDWTTTGTMTAVQYGASGGFPGPTSPGPSNRGKNFFAGGPSASLSTAVQTVDVAAGASQIDRGHVRFVLKAYLGGFQDQDDDANVAIAFLSKSGGQLGTATIGPVTPEQRQNITGLLKRHTQGRVPIGTRSISITITATKYDFTYNDGYADELNLILSP